MSAVTITPPALERLRTLVADAPGSIGVRVGVNAKGCNGMSYVLELATDARAYEETVDLGAVRLLLDPMSFGFILGTEIDWESDAMQSRFVFRNPNEASRCGCGKSFSV
jgi:iron-sulfur cluster assembly protein